MIEKIEIIDIRDDLVKYTINEFWNLSISEKKIADIDYFRIEGQTSSFEIDESENIEVIDYLQENTVILRQILVSYCKLQLIDDLDNIFATFYLKLDDNFIKNARKGSCVIKLIDSISTFAVLSNKTTPLIFSQKSSVDIAYFQEIIAFDQYISSYSNIDLSTDDNIIGITAVNKVENVGQIIEYMLKELYINVSNVNANFTIPVNNFTIELEKRTWDYWSADVSPRNYVNRYFRIRAQVRVDALGRKFLTIVKVYTGCDKYFVSTTIGYKYRLIINYQILIYNISDSLQSSLWQEYKGVTFGETLVDTPEEVDNFNYIINVFNILLELYNPNTDEYYTPFIFNLDEHNIGVSIELSPLQNLSVEYAELNGELFTYNYNPIYGLTGMHLNLKVPLTSFESNIAFNSDSEIIVSGNLSIEKYYIFANEQDNLGNKTLFNYNFKISEFVRTLLAFKNLAIDSDNFGNISFINKPIGIPVAIIELEDYWNYEEVYSFIDTKSYSLSGVYGESNYSEFLSDFYNSIRTFFKKKYKMTKMMNVTDRLIGNVYLLNNKRCLVTSVKPYIKTLLNGELMADITLIGE